MSVPSAYLGVILIWSTTPLAIKWSGEQSGFLFGVTARMTIGVMALLLIVSLLRVRMSWHLPARLTYLAAGGGIYFTMIGVSWAAAFVPSGWISVLFGLSPMITGLFSGLWLNEKVFTLSKTLGLLMALFGLMIIFGESARWSEQAVISVIVIILSVAAQASSAVLVKKVNTRLPAIVTTTGAMIVATPLFLLTWFVSGNIWPEHVSQHTAYSIVYLGLFGSVAGFALYYYVLHKVSAMRVALLTLITPVFALLLGHWVNHEPLQQGIWIGSALIMAGLLAYENQFLKQQLRKNKESSD